MSIAIEVYGKADDMICAGCDGQDCGGFSPQGLLDELRKKHQG